MLIACNESVLQPGWQRATASRPGGTAPGPARALSGNSLERHCTILSTASLPVHVAYLLDPERVSAFQDTCAEIRRAHPKRQFLIERKEASMSTSIAVIDDDAACRELLHDLLSEEGYAVHLLPDSATAARCLRDLAPAAIILDVRLENPTAGWEVLADLRQDPVLHATPVLMCSADLSALQEHAGELGRQGCALLAKPFDLDELLVLLQHLARGTPSASPAATGTGRCAPVCAAD
jgi:CheY-like chemotaxis protein